MDSKQSSKKTVFSRILIILECLIIAICIGISVVVIINPGTMTSSGGMKTRFLPVKTDSMTPTIGQGSLIKTKKPTSSILDLGTVVTFVVYSNPNYLDTHRIVGYRYYDENGAFHIEYYKKGEMQSASDFYNKYQGKNYVLESYVTRGDKYTVLYGDESLNDLGFSKDNSSYEKQVNFYDDLPYVSFSQVVAVYDYHISGAGYILLWVMKPINFFIVIIVPLILLFAYNVYDIIKYVVSEKVRKQTVLLDIDKEEIKRQAIYEYLASQNQTTVPTQENEHEKEDK